FVFNHCCTPGPRQGRCVPGAFAASTILNLAAMCYIHGGSAAWLASSVGVRPPRRHYLFKRRVFPPNNRLPGAYRFEVSLVASIRIGPAGIPLSCKGRTIKDGVIYTRNLELDAIQVQFVRGIRTTEEEALEVGRVAREANVEVHVHAPYYTNLAGDQSNLEMAFDKIVSAGALADAMGARTLAIHCGLYDDAGPEKTMEIVTGSIGELLDTFKQDGIKVRLGLEVAGKQALFGTLEEILEVCRRVPGTIPVLDFAHIHARSNGGLQTQEDFQKVFDACRFLNLPEYLLHFTGVLYDNGSERHHLPIKKGDLRFEPLVDVILDNEYNVTLISESPILEHDAMYMQIVFDRVKEKREQKAAKDLEERE
ncbi:MAG: TIM barrel protein, partial [bacterium]